MSEQNTDTLTRSPDDLGRIVIPAETRRLLNINPGNPLTIQVQGSSIVLRKLEAGCTFCGTDETKRPLVEYNGKSVCESCLGAISRIVESRTW